MNSNSNSNNNYEYYNNRQEGRLIYQPEFNENGRLQNPLEYIRDNIHVISYTRTMYGNLFPTTRGNEPQDIIESVKEMYAKIRKIRETEIGLKMTGVKIKIICAICLHVELQVERKIILPISMFVNMINDKQITLKNFETYLRSPDKGVLRFLTKKYKNYLDKKLPSFYLTFTMKRVLEISNEDWKKIISLVNKYSKEYPKELEIRSGAYIVYAAIYHVTNNNYSKYTGISHTSYKHISEQIKKLN